MISNAKLQAAKAVGLQRLAAMLDYCAMDDRVAVESCLQDAVEAAVKLGIVPDPYPPPVGTPKRTAKVVPDDISAPSRVNFNDVAWADALRRTIAGQVTLPCGVDDDGLTDRSLLWSCVRHGHIDLLLYLVKVGLDGNERDERGMRVLDAALLTACRDGSLPQTTALVEMGANIDTHTEYGMSALHLACQGVNRLGVVKYLLEHGGNMHALTKEGESLFHIVCASGGADVARLLLEDMSFNYLTRRRRDNATGESLLTSGGGVTGVVRAQILELLSQRKARDAVFYYNNAMMAQEDEAVKRVRKLLDQKEERHRRADAARRQRLRVLQELFALKNDIAFAEAHKAAVIQSWSDAEHYRMQAQLAVRRLQEQATQDRITKANVLQMNEELKEQLKTMEEERDEVMDHARIMVHDFREPVTCGSDCVIM